MAPAWAEVRGERPGSGWRRNDDRKLNQLSGNATYDALKLTAPMICAYTGAEPPIAGPRMATG